MSGETFLGIVMFIATSAMPAALIWGTQLLTESPLSAVSLSNVAVMLRRSVSICGILQWRWTCDVLVTGQDGFIPNALSLEIKLNF